MNDDLLQTLTKYTDETPLDHSYHQRLWRPLYYLNLYRLCLSSIFVFLSVSGTLPLPLGTTNPQLFFTLSLGYLIFSLTNILSIAWRRPGYNIQVYSHVLIDIFAITLMMHASGGVSSGMGMLLIVAIAGGSLLMAGKTANFFAAIATFAVLGEQFYSSLKAAIPAYSYTQAGLLGASFFATAVLAHVLATRLRASEHLAQQRGIDLANMAQLTEYIIQRMQTGILVIDSDDNIRLINQSAHHLIGASADHEGQSINSIAPILSQQLHDWWENPGFKPKSLRTSTTTPEVLPRFARLGSERDAGTLIFLEDLATTAQQVQQLKLASLGRLTASIAHEIRNPLGAIGHAGQLLAESEHLDNGDKRLIEIIDKNTLRVNIIIENIMQLSRRDRTYQEDFSLTTYLQQFQSEFCNSEHVSTDQVQLSLPKTNIEARFDLSQLHQILWNLCENGLRHSQNSQHPGIHLRAGLQVGSRHPYLDVIDQGCGIDDEHAENIFEPFFTTENEGTGLGLYISRELCECNQALLDYIKPADGGSCFRISFADPRRRQVS